MKIIDLNPDDDIISVCDMLAWQGDLRVVLRLPDGAGLLAEGLALARLRRQADRLRVDVGLVTCDRSVARKAKALGLPAFATLEEAEMSRRGWWRGRRRRELIGLPTLGGDRLLTWREAPDKAPAAKATPAITRRHWLFRYVAILLFFSASAFLFIGVSYGLPRATIILKPQVIEARALPQLLVDPALPVVDYARRAVPGRLIEIRQTWSEETNSSGSAIVPLSQARGRVIFVNRTDQAVAVPRGTLLSTADGSVVFQTATTLRMIGVISSTAEIDVFAVEPGPQANVAAGSITTIQVDLAASLAVNNPEPMSGGELRQVAAVTEEDRRRLRAQVLQFLQAVSWADMQRQLTERELLPRESLRVIGIDSEVYSHAAGEPADVLRLKMEARLQGTAVDLTQTSGLVYEALAASVPQEFTLVAGSIQYEPGDVLSVDEAGRVSLVMESSGLIAADLAFAGPLADITGQEPEYALAYLLQQLPLRATPQMEVWPTWFERVPYRIERISVEVLTDG